MAQRTYLIGLYLAAYALYRYITKHQAKLFANPLTPQQETCLNSTLQAVTDCVQLFTPAPPVE